MPSPENVGRNKGLVQKRIQDPKKWTFESLGKYYGISREFAYYIFQRDRDKYAVVDKS